LHAKGIDYEYRAVNLAPDVQAQTSEDYAQVNPLQQVPTLEWQEGSELVRLTQSVAIIEYLDDLQPEPALLPRAALWRARVREAVEIVNSGIQPFQNTWTLAEVRRLGGDSAALPWMSKALQRGLRALEAHASRFAGSCSVGDSISMADVYLVPQLYHARRFGIDIAQFPRLIAIDDYLNQQPAFWKARPEVQPDAAGA
jgi:maleylpyruvate isomerase